MKLQQLLEMAPQVERKIRKPNENLAKAAQAAKSNFDNFAQNGQEQIEKELKIAELEEQLKQLQEKLLQTKVQAKEIYTNTHGDLLAKSENAVKAQLTDKAEIEAADLAKRTEDFELQTAQKKVTKAQAKQLKNEHNKNAAKYEDVILRANIAENLQHKPLNLVQKVIAKIAF